MALIDGAREYGAIHNRRYGGGGEEANPSIATIGMGVMAFILQEKTDRMGIEWQNVTRRWIRNEIESHA